ncbi:Uncaracterized surface protein containing fasciclin (FAS1) repeats [Mesonia phycicola]|uniref:Uncaracterized surface protein containing fasciclin (FAS1) repeats n=1 Tax=Mesonia phycicola TaxID=579105 RepID=A0A1M6DZN8_9FLAO|nr:fasciclin domain-containing protein [Mesonia phycicola]SHI78603.1 Uncaracterized surface protein containing fasciclin (FAS1) repeats [Mesonia phycicola]
MKKQNLFSILLLVCSFTFVGCSDDDDSTSDAMDDSTIAEIVIESENYSSLEAALIKADLVTTLSGDTEYTVFAPDNDAFAEFLSDNGFNSLEDVPTDVLKQVLLNHVIQGEVESDEISTGYVTNLAVEETSQANLSMYLDTSNGVTINGEVAVVNADIDAENGVIHAVDKVIALPTVVTFATADPNFSILVNALTREDSFSYVSTLSTPAGSSPAPFTVFAPTNDAFADLLAELEVSDLSDIDTETLAATLNMHVIAGANVRAEDLTSGDVTTLGGDVTINESNATITDANGRVSTVIVTNVQATNGVVHAIDKVILPAL